MNETTIKNEIQHKIKVNVNVDELVTFISKQTQVILEGKIDKITAYHYTSSDVMEFEITSIVEDRLKILEHKK
jgi:hypothetical protein